MHLQQAEQALDNLHRRTNARRLESHIGDAVDLDPGGDFHLQAGVVGQGQEPLSHRAY